MARVADRSLEHQPGDCRQVQFLQTEDSSTVSAVHAHDTKRINFGTYKRLVWGSILALCCLAPVAAFIMGHGQHTSAGQSRAESQISDDFRQHSAFISATNTAGKNLERAAQPGYPMDPEDDEDTEMDDDELIGTAGSIPLGIPKYSTPKPQPRSGIQYMESLGGKNSLEVAFARQFQKDVVDVNKVLDVAANKKQALKVLEDSAALKVYDNTDSTIQDASTENDSE